MLCQNAVPEKLLGLTRELQQVDPLTHFVLVGGTALALQMGHRLSVDIDLFSPGIVKREIIERTLEKKYADNYKRILVTENSLTCIISDIKVDILKYDYPFIENIIEADGIRMAGIPDIIAMKLDAITGNGTRAKDFIDIYYLSEIYPLDSMFDFYQLKYKHNDIFHVKKSLTYFDDIDPESWNSIQLLKDPGLTPEEVKSKIRTLTEQYEKLPKHRPHSQNNQNAEGFER